MAGGDEIRPLVAHQASVKLVGPGSKREPPPRHGDPILVTNVEPADEDNVLVHHGFLYFLRFRMAAISLELRYTAAQFCTSRSRAGPDVAENNSAKQVEGQRDWNTVWRA